MWSAVCQVRTKTLADFQSSAAPSPPTPSGFNFMHTLVLSKTVQHWSLISLLDRTIKIG